MTIRTNSLSVIIGAQTYRALPKWQDNVVDTEGNPGFTLSKYKTQDLTAQPDSVGNYPSADYLDPNERVGAITLDGTFKPQSTGSHYLEAFSLGPSKVLINGEQVSEITKDHDDPMAVLLSAAVGEIFQYKFTADQTYKIRIEALAATGNASGVALLDNLPSIKVGFVPQEDYEVNLVTEAVTAAKDADIAIVFVGNPSDWESEGVDMTTMNLPANGSQDLLISSVASVNPNTIVINFAGVAIAMPWLPQIKSFVQVWFPGQEGGNAIVDILFGNVNPSGKLPVSFPKSLEVTPAYGNFPGDLEKLQVHYKEGIYMGYRHYDLHPEDVLFPFGFGLSYTTFDFSNIKISSALLELKSTINVEIDVTNTGKLAGSEVVQVYVGRKSECSIDVPVKKLAGFAKVFLKPGETKTRSVEFGQDAAAYWHEDRYQWVVEEGDFEIIVATSSAKEDFKQKFDLSVSETFTYGP